MDTYSNWLRFILFRLGCLLAFTGPRQQLLRNVCVALGNAGDPTATPALTAALVDRHPLVRGHAAWALGRLGARDVLVARRHEEREMTVRAEIEAALIATCNE